jgi:hypothetical protein
MKIEGDGTDDFQPGKVGMFIMMAVGLGSENPFYHKKARSPVWRRAS